MYLSGFWIHLHSQLQWFDHSIFWILSYRWNDTGVCKNKGQFIDLFLVSLHQCANLSCRYRPADVENVTWVWKHHSPLRISSDYCLINTLPVGRNLRTCRVSYYSQDFQRSSIRLLWKCSPFLPNPTLCKLHHPPFNLADHFYCHDKTINHNLVRCGRNIIWDWSRWGVFQQFYFRPKLAKFGC